MKPRRVADIFRMLKIAGNHGTLNLQVWRESEGVCWICGMRIPDPRGEHKDRGPRAALRMSVDHVVARSIGGTNQRDNLKAAHRFCNSLRGSAQLNEQTIARAKLKIQNCLSQLSAKAEE